MTHHIFEKPIFVVSAPSGAGKTTLNRRLVKEHAHVELSISHTTRQPRQGEEAGGAYHFTNKEKFMEMASQGAFLEWAEVHGNLYGTSFSELNRIAQQDHIPLLEIDVQGWQQCRPQLPQARSVFILPPSLKALWERLQGRGSDSLATRWLRLQNALHEIATAHDYSHFMINDHLETAYESLCSILIHQENSPLSPAQGLAKCQELKEEFKEAEWVKDIQTGFNL